MDMRAMAMTPGMEEALSRLLADYSLSHYEHALEAVGLKCIEDLQLMEDEDLLAVGMQRIQRRAFARLREDAAEQRAGGAGLRRAAEPPAQAWYTLLGSRCSALEPFKQPLLGNRAQASSSSSSPLATEAPPAKLFVRPGLPAVVPPQAPPAKHYLGQGLAAAAAGAARGAAVDLLGRDAAEMAHSLVEVLSRSKVASVAKTPAAFGRQDGEASPLPHLLGQTSGCERQEPPHCVILDGRLVTPTHTGGWCEGQGPQQRGFLSVHQLRTAFDWFQERAPSCRVRILLCGGRKDQWRAHPLLHDIAECLIWKPSGSDVDRFLVEMGSRGHDCLRVQIATNSRFQRLLGASVCEKTINAGWVEQHTIRFTFSGVAFCPALDTTAAAYGVQKPERPVSRRPFPLKVRL